MVRLNTLQDDLNYQYAKRSLRQLVHSLDLTAPEKRGFEDELVDLNDLLSKLDKAVVHVAAFGMVGRGKSSLLNALLGYEAFTTGPTHGVTQSIQQVPWQTTWDTDPVLPSPRSAIRTASLKGLAGSCLELIDTPGLDEVEGETRAQLAYRVARKADLILFVVSGDMTRIEYRALAELRNANKPMVLVFNKVDQYPDLDRQAIYDTIRNERVRKLLSPNEVVMAAASPRIPKAVVLENGSVTARLEEGPPNVEAVRLKIFEILTREGRSLMALNALLFADQLQQALVQRKLAWREEQAEHIIWTAARAKAIAVGLNPITLVDTVGAAVIDVSLVVKLSQVYGLPMTTEGATQLLQRIILGMLSLGVGEWVAMVGLGSLKTILSTATPFTGGFAFGAYASVALTQATLAGMSCYAVGAAAKAYLANGASWGTGGPKRVIAQILDHLDEASITVRIRDELTARLHQSEPLKTSSGMD